MYTMLQSRRGVKNTITDQSRPYLYQTIVIYSCRGLLKLNKESSKFQLLIPHTVYKVKKEIHKYKHKITKLLPQYQIGRHWYLDWYRGWYRSNVLESCWLVDWYPELILIIWKLCNNFTIFFLLEILVL